MYRKKTVQAGATLEVEKYGYYGSRPKRSRGPRKNPTPESMKRANERAAVRKLTWLINENFSPGDYSLTLTYREAPEAEQAKAQLKKFLRRLRGVYQKEGKELKYISVTEYLSRRIHHHLVVNAIGLRKIMEVWTEGRLRATVLDGSGSYWRLAEYLYKEVGKSRGEGYHRHISPSRNLKRPEPVCRDVSAGRWRKEPAEKIRYRGAEYYPDASRPWERWVDERTGMEHTICYYRRI